MNHIHPLSALQRVAPHRKAGYLEECLRLGQVNGALIEFTPEVYHHLKRRFALPPQRKGLGDLVAAVATPIARALKLKCIDPLTRQLRPESKCAERKRRLNEAGFKIIPPKI